MDGGLCEISERIQFLVVVSEKCKLEVDALSKVRVMWKKES